ncbi:DUF2164 domain-containing protein [uncultured Ferrimonas sp.]|uniref:DUF2164 domain-containing protein n=1 Tax=uncultured Ferrimonas sp. TaxID=432640 RepID=UPI002630670D|nr:DUF2164 domain-containing protein [uncultured Ferrimonas sp.]
MSEIELSRQQKQQIATELQRYCEREFELDIGQFEAEFLLDFMVKLVGPEIYNRALTDAAATMENRLNDLRDDLYQIEQPSQLR